MAENIEITVKVNGVETPLHQINKLTLLKIRENSKPTEVPIARVGNSPYSSDNRRLLLKITEEIREQSDQVIAIDLVTGRIVGHWNKKYGYDRDYYKNIQVIS